MPHRHNTDIQSLRASFTKGGGDVTALVKNGGTWWAWSHVTKGLYKTSAIFCHIAIGSLATSALSALLIFDQAYSITCFPFPFFSFVSLLMDYQLYRLACIFPAVLVPRLIELLTARVLLPNCYSLTPLPKA